MIEKTNGICLKIIPFKESSVIVQIFTEKFGRQSYIAGGVRSKNPKRSKAALYQILNQIQLTAWHKESREIQRISEVKLAYAYRTLNQNPRKIAVGFFLTEIFLKILKTQENDAPLFNFLCNALRQYDLLDRNYANFHLQFLLKLLNFFGFGLENASVLTENSPRPTKTTTLHTIINELINNDFDNTLHIKNTERQEILSIIISFYKYHFDGFGDLKSWDILKDLQ